ncbi:TPA: hypothetical protein KKX32_001284 [Legionella pneumophila]|uniref:hypothetical protein n=1 Tax=Legionella pneumophila TaxID=446 RepID=UPI00078BA033|nr:hypothetical protein [Legionella pneumophila]HCC3257046.1 hypothetical protein [Legionella pneumophila subsp. pneumophila]AMV15204.1 hypothetical protein ULM_25440 [Legionella pneumophila]MBN5929873.1 hypothetical protein [Legionella pneumophila]MDF1929928.1 hypothetical protein [Legionella pneumophila]WII10794.1 hypothetical protein PT258_11885 [Legionella pneumophila]
MNHETELMDLITEKYEDLVIPGFLVEVSPIEADIMGAFFEDALNEVDAMEAIYD